MGLLMLRSSALGVDVYHLSIDHIPEHFSKPVDLIGSVLHSRKHGGELIEAIGELLNQLQPVIDGMSSRRSALRFLLQFCFSDCDLVMAFYIRDTLLYFLGAIK